jgi:O-antigen ligase
MPTYWRVALILVALAGMLMLSFNPGNVLEIRADDPLDRTSIWRNTVMAIGAYLPLGSGFGSFDLVYPGVESASDIGSSFINHAHNEYLELLLEGGVAAGALLLAYLGLLLFAMWRLPSSPLRSAAFCGLLFILLHSAVDYPLRNLSITLVLALLNGLVFSTRLRVPSRRRQQ